MVLKMVTKWAVFTLLTSFVCDAYKILVIFPVPGKSHGILGDAYVRHLLEAGHEVTYVTPFPKQDTSNLHHVNISSIKEVFNEDTIHIKAIMDKQLNFKDRGFIFELMGNISSATVRNENVQRLLRDPKQQFDVVIAEWMFSEMYSAPLYDIQRITYKNHIVPILKEKVKSIPSFEELRYNASLVLGNSHVSLGFPTRVPQNYKGIGGYHIDTKVKPLPEDLKKIMDDSKRGVIYFSMGSNMKSKDLPVELKKSFLRMFSEFNQTVIWKFEEVLPDLPENVYIRHWAPQQSILAHPNCVLFITHGGLLSITEAIHYGVPIIGIPVFADQFRNVDTAVNKGIARKVDLSYDMDGELNNTIREMLNNPKYRQKVKELSLVYHDRLVPPGAELVFWVEHVIKTNGALHLRSLALHVPWYQKLYLDLLALVIAILLAIKMLLSNIYCKISYKSRKRKFE
ncbi:UDP-glycosyltransferase UGT5 isoform X2 [Manduca sexta]|uniref:UDP-glycosyltransferase UGT5 isoform X2 n=1 Tax=Manduca sexta TaxID=7130 RepID=UPI0011840EE4|nr:UDP-glycosyltransferase UGT5 isoform X2 [Manduca sexta]